MNIFLLDTDPKLAAQYHCDKHVVKMPLEYAQLLSTTMHHYGLDGPYKVTHQNHPCAVWARQYEGNYEFLYSLALALGEEYTARYSKVHKSTQLLYDGIIPSSINMGQATKQRSPLPNCTTIKDYYPELNLVDKYRLYYLRDKANILQFKTEEPWWVGDRFYQQQLKAIGRCPGDKKDHKPARVTKDELAAQCPALKGLLVKDLEKLPEFKQYTGELPTGRLKKPYLVALAQVHPEVNWSKLTVAAMTEVLNAYRHSSNCT